MDRRRDSNLVASIAGLTFSTGSVASADEDATIRAALGATTIAVETARAADPMRRVELVDLTAAPDQEAAKRAAYCFARQCPAIYGFYAV
jgi:hypothetical protein